ncbi:MAG: RluA family pseudouridine synthase [Planctomycetes bacterium]|nr:RluA family pseudouridine synthase [Planctomycetota bacterium]
MPEILHCDNHMIALVKPAGMPVVPDSSGDLALSDWAKDWIKREYNKPGDVFLGVVHRLDRPVSGIVVFGRTSKGASRLSAAWRDGKVRKIYHGISDAPPTLAVGDEGEIVQWLVKDRERNIVRVVTPPVTLSQDSQANPKEARSKWRIIAVERGKTLLELEPITGRAHQLRLACAKLGLPLMGDLKYGATSAMAGRRIGLHAIELIVPHPTLGELIHLTSAFEFF